MNQRCLTNIIHFIAEYSEFEPTGTIISAVNTSKFKKPAFLLLKFDGIITDSGHANVRIIELDGQLIIEIESTIKFGLKNTVDLYELLGSQELQDYVLNEWNNSVSGKIEHVILK